MTVRVGAALWVASAAVYVAAEAYAATGIAGYGYATDYISTLGDPAVSPHATVMNAAFVVQAVALPLGGWLVLGRRDSLSACLFRGFVVCNGVGNVLVAAVHSGSGSAWHGVGAGLAIGGGNLAVLAGAWALRPPSRIRAASIAMGAAGLACLALLPGAAEPIGVWERISVYSIYGWQVLAAVWLLGSRRAVDAGRERA